MASAEAKKQQSQAVNKSNAEASAKVKNTISNSKQSIGDNRGYNYSNSGGRHDDGKTPQPRQLSQQEMNWLAVQSPNSTMPRNKQSQEQQTQNTGMANRAISVELNESLTIQDVETGELKKIDRRTKQVAKYITELRNERKKKLDQARIDGKKTLEANLRRAQQELTNAQGMGGGSSGHLRSGRPALVNRAKYKNEEKRKRIEQAHKTIASLENQNSNYHRRSDAQIAKYDPTIAQSDKTISYYENENTNIKKELVAERSGSFATSDDSKKRKGARGARVPKNRAVSYSIAGAGIARQNVDRFKSFFGFDDKPKGTLKSVELKENFPLNEGTPRKQSKWMPTEIETGSTQFSSAKIGDSKDYLSTASYGKSKNRKTVLPSGETITFQNKPQGNRGVAGAMAVPENFFTLGKEGGEAFASDVKQGKVGTFKPTELKKDIIITGIGTFAQEIEPSSKKIARGDLSGITDYVSKTGKHVGDFAKDIGNDPAYYLSNAGANVMLVAGTFGIGGASSGIRGAMGGVYQKRVVAPKAKSMLDYTHPPKDVSQRLILTCLGLPQFLI